MSEYSVELILILLKLLCHENFIKTIKMFHTRKIIRNIRVTLFYIKFGVENSNLRINEFQKF